MDTFQHVPGGQYRSRENPDGTFDFFNVPVFSEVPKGIKGAPVDIGTEQLQEAVSLHQRLFQDDRHLARLTVLHNFGLHKAEPAGFFLPKRVGMMTMKGQTFAVVFADFVNVPPSVVDRIDAYELPYCSAEIRTWEPLQFGACSLLDTEDPFFQFPIITRQNTEPTVSADVTRFHTDKQEPAVAAFVSGSGSRFLFNFGGADMPDDEKKKDDDQEFAEEGGNAVDSAAIVKMIEDGSIPIGDFDAIEAAISARKGEAEPEMEEADDESPVDLDGPPGLSKTPEAEMSADPDLKGEVAGLRARVDAMETEKRVKHFVAKAEDDLADYTLTDADRDDLASYYGEGEERGDRYVAAFKRNAMKDPPNTLDGGGLIEDGYPPEVMPYFNQGPEAATQARRIFTEWSELDKAGIASSSLEKYMKRHMARVGG